MTVGMTKMPEMKAVAAGAMMSRNPVEVSWRQIDRLIAEHCDGRLSRSDLEPKCLRT
jgi:hypothetical protein